MMVDIKKQKAERNRTLTVSQDEIPSLESSITTIDNLKNVFQDNMIINADLFDCIDMIPNDYFDLVIVDPPTI